jgi:hypothetical protein
LTGASLNELWPPLYFVQHHQPFEGCKSERGILKPGQSGWVFQVESRYRSALALGQFSGKGGLADLPGAKNGNNRIVPEQSLESRDVT